MAFITVDSDKCKGCGLCVSVCPKKIVVITEKTNKSGYHAADCIDNSKCIGCAFCAIMCPDSAIEVDK